MLIFATIWREKYLYEQVWKKWNYNILYWRCKLTIQSNIYASHHNGIKLAYNYIQEIKDIYRLELISWIYLHNYTTNQLRNHYVHICNDIERKYLYHKDWKNEIITYFTKYVN